MNEDMRVVASASIVFLALFDSIILAGGNTENTHDARHLERRVGRDATLSLPENELASLRGGDRRSGNSDKGGRLRGVTRSGAPVRW